VKRRPGSEYRTQCAIPRDSSEWKRAYARRTSGDRVFGRLKETLRLERHCYRCIEKVELHCLLSVLTLQAKAIVQIEVDESPRQWLWRQHHPLRSGSVFLALPLCQFKRLVDLLQRHHVRRHIRKRIGVPSAD
jgi:hypothetical protein